MNVRETVIKFRLILLAVGILALSFIAIALFLPRHKYLTGAEIYLKGNYIILGLLPQDHTELGYDLVVIRTNNVEDLNKGIGSSELLLRWTGNNFEEASGLIENGFLLPASPRDLDQLLGDKARIKDTSDALNKKNPSFYQNSGTRPGLPLRADTWIANLYLGAGNTRVRQLNLLYDDEKILITAYEINNNKSAEINLRYAFIPDSDRPRIGEIEYFYRPVVESGLLESLAQTIANLIKGKMQYSS